MTTALRLGLACCAAVLSACEWILDSRDLTAVSAAPQAPVDCAACHSYSGIDGNHSFHMSLSGRQYADRGPVTCMDCHFTAMAHQDVRLLDSIFTDSTGYLWSLLEYDGSDFVRGLTLIRVDTLSQQHPIPMPTPIGPKPGAIPEYQQYVTALAHLNGVMDVAFGGRETDTAKFRGALPGYDMKEQTCSSVACHRRRSEYQWRRLPEGL
jgi:hypothetical protein